MKDRTARSCSPPTRRRFLSTVQIGITLVGILAGRRFGRDARPGGCPTGRSSKGSAPPSRIISASALVVTVITYFSLIVGELVPKQIALRDPERIACMVAPAMTLLARVGAPFGVAARRFRQGRARAVRRRRGASGGVTEEEIRTVVGGSRGRRRAAAAGARHDLGACCGLATARSTP